MKKYSLLVLWLIVVACQPKEKEITEEWIKLFNGHDLSGWTPKISGYEVGNNFNNTFLVEDGILKVNYAEYDSFRGEYGHLIYKEPFTDYRLRIEYRFVDGRPPGGEDWANLNSGVMIHCQSVESMGIDQDFPVSLEAQFLAGTPEWERSTMNLCTPGTNVFIADTLNTQHCINAKTKTYMSGEWVTIEVIAYHDSIVHHVVEGDTVFTYTKPTIGGGHLPQNYPIAEGTPVKGGYISLQAESHPVQFARVELLDLSKKKSKK